jgi:hypothetical protein
VICIHYNLLELYFMAFPGAGIAGGRGVCFPNDLCHTLMWTSIKTQKLLIS